MSHKHLLFTTEARTKVFKGANQLADAVRVTLGPKSKSVLIERKWGVPLVCNDGVTIAKEIDLKDPEENLGAQMLRQAAQKTGDAVGDGTSTATVLAHAVFVTVEEAKGTETSLEVVEGMQFDHGYLSPYFVTDPERMECVLEGPVILLHDKRIGSLNDLLPLLEQVVKAGKPLPIVAEEVEGVVRVALKNAVSVASVLFLTEATLTELPEPKEAPAAPAME